MALPFVTERKAEKVVKEVIREGGITGGFSIPTIDLDKEEYHLSEEVSIDLENNPLHLKDNVEIPVDLEKCPIIRFKTEYINAHGGAGETFNLDNFVVSGTDKRDEIGVDYFLKPLGETSQVITNLIKGGELIIHRVSDKYYLNFNWNTFGIKHREITIKTYKATFSNSTELGGKQTLENVEPVEELVFKGDCGVFVGSMRSQEGWIWKRETDEPVNSISDVLSTSTNTYTSVDTGERVIITHIRMGNYNDIYVKPMSEIDSESYKYLLASDAQLSDVNTFYVYFDRDSSGGGK